MMSVSMSHSFTGGPKLWMRKKSQPRIDTSNRVRIARREGAVLRRHEFGAEGGRDVGGERRMRATGRDDEPLLRLGDEAGSDVVIAVEIDRLLLTRHRPLPVRTEPGRRLPPRPSPVDSSRPTPRRCAEGRRSMPGLRRARPCG